MGRTWNWGVVHWDVVWTLKMLQMFHASDMPITRCRHSRLFTDNNTFSTRIDRWLPATGSYRFSRHFACPGKTIFLHLHMGHLRLMHISISQKYWNEILPHPHLYHHSIMTNIPQGWWQYYLVSQKNRGWYQKQNISTNPYYINTWRQNQGWSIKLHGTILYPSDIITQWYKINNAS